MSKKNKKNSKFRKKDRQETLLATADIPVSTPLARGAEPCALSSEPTDQYPSMLIAQEAAKQGTHIPHDPDLLACAQTQWQFGDWDSLIQLQPQYQPETLQHHPDRVRIILYAAAGHLQIGSAEIGKQLIKQAQSWGASKKHISRMLISGLHNTLGRAQATQGQEQAALQHFESSIDACESHRATELITSARARTQLEQIHTSQITTRLGLPSTDFQLDSNLQDHIPREERKLFIDCGGYDGCSALMFLFNHPGYDCITFEPNPELWKFYTDIPAQLIRKAVWIHDGEVRFTIDPVDSDGSTLMEGKRVVFDNSVSNADCPVLDVPCVNLSAFIRKMSEHYGHIVLKLDVEGAEYDILEKMLADDTLKLVDRLHAEFHAHKMTIDPTRHDRLLGQLKKQLPIEFWDASSLSIVSTSKQKERANFRSFVVKTIHNNRKKIF